MTKAAALAITLLLAACPGDDDPAGPEWTLSVETDAGAILSFWGESTSSLYAIGGTLAEGGGEGMILWHDGDAWWRMETDLPTLWWGHGFGDADVWAVGEQGTIAHFDGQAWVAVEGGETYTLWGIWGASPAEMWAVGGSIDGSGPGIILRYDGDSWTDVPGVGMPGELLFKVWGTAADDVFVVGDGGAILHWDGQDWARMASPTTQRLLTVRGRGPDDVYAVGGITQSVLLHYDGNEWTDLEVDLGGGLMGVWTAPGQPALVTGFSGLMAVGDMGGWTDQERTTFECLHGTWGDGLGNFVAGGGNLVSVGPRRGVIVSGGDIAAGPVRPIAER